MLFAVIFFFALGAIVDSREARGQSCPTGWNSRTFTFTYDTCQVSVTYCYICPPTHMVEVQLSYYSVSPPGCATNPEDLYIEVQRAAHNDLINVCASHIDPCTDPISTTSNMTVNQKMCWFARNRPSQNRVEYIHCPDTEAYCATNYVLCIDHSETPPKQKWFKLNSTLIGDVSECPLIDLFFKDNGYPSHLAGHPNPMGVPWQTPCFKFSEDGCLEIPW